jgi:hypothetical protein
VKAKTNDRVSWILTQNLHSDPDQAWFEMYETCRNQAQLKANAGLSARGRKNDKPVLHYTLAWHEDDKPTPERMREAALASLKVLGLEDHEALIVAHDDKKHPHVHIVANTVHPYTGRTAALKYSKERLSEWAEAHEREHGRIRCEERVKNNEQRRQIREHRKRENAATKVLTAGSVPVPQNAPYVPIKDKSPSRPQWFDKKDIVDRMKRLRAELDLRHKLERGITWERQCRERDGLDQNTKAAIDNARGHVRTTFRPQWRRLYQIQGREQRFVAESATHPPERAVFVFRNRHRLGHGKALTIRQMVGVILSTKRLMKMVEQTHQRERRDLAREQKTLTKGLTERIWAIHRERFHTLRDRQETERTVERAHQHIATREITLTRAKEHLLHEIDNPPPARPMPVKKRERSEPTQEFNAAAQGHAHEISMSRSEEIRRDMEEWRKFNRGHDFGHEL